MPNRESARAKIRAFLEQNVGEIVTSRQISEVSGIIAHARRVRELRDDFGMRISTHRDRSDLKPGEYCLETLEARAVEARSAIPRKLRNQVLDRDGYTCQKCGLGAGDVDPYNSGRRVKLQIDHILPSAQGGNTEIDNLRALCSTCNEGQQNIQPASETAKNILARTSVATPKPASCGHLKTGQ
jgi:hypothetical protein